MNNQIYNVQIKKKNQKKQNKTNGIQQIEKERIWNEMKANETKIHI